MGLITREVPGGARAVARLSSEPAGTVRLCPGKVSCDSYLHPPRDTFLHLLSDCGDSIWIWVTDTAHGGLSLW